MTQVFLNVNFTFCGAKKKKSPQLLTAKFVVHEQEVMSRFLELNFILVFFFIDVTFFFFMDLI